MGDETTEDVLEQYASLKSIIADCEKKLEEIRPEVLELVLSAGGKTIPEGTFSIMRKPSYEYSEATMTMEIDLKAKKKEEEMEGIATIKGETEILTFKKAK